MVNYSKVLKMNLGNYNMGTLGVDECVSQKDADKRILDWVISNGYKLDDAAKKFVGLEEDK